MKMKNLIAFAMLALGAVAAPFAGRGDTTGDIYEIERLNGDYGVTNGFPSAENPIVLGGQEIRFVIHLAAKDADTKPSDYTNWYLEYLGIGSKIVDDLMNPLRIGIVVSGKLRWASLTDYYVNTNCPSTYDTTHRTCGGIFDAVFSYTVQPGDYAQPIRLALEGSTEDNPIAAFGAAANFAFQNRDKWWFRNKDGDNCTFALVENGRRADMRDKANAWPNPSSDLTLAESAFYVRTVNFLNAEESAWEKPGEYWTSVEQGSGRTTSGHPAALIVSSMPSKNSRLYAWTTNDTVVTMSGGTPTEMGMPPGGVSKQTFSVASIDIYAGREEYVIPLRGVTVSSKPVDVFVSQYPGFRYKASGQEAADWIKVPVRCVEAPKPGVRISFDREASDFKYNDGEAIVAPYDSGMPTPIPMYVTLSDFNGLSAEKFPDGVDIELNAKLVKDAYADDDVYTNKYVWISLDTSDTGEEVRRVHFEPGQYQVPIYLFVRGGDGKTASGLKFSPTSTNATFNTEYTGDRMSAQIFVRDAYPLLQLPENEQMVTADAITGFNLDVQVLDCYRDMMSTNFTVRVGGQELKNVEFARDMATKCHFNSPGNETEYRLPVSVTDQNGNTTTNKATIIVTVTPAKTVTVDFVAKPESEEKIPGTTYYENSNGTFSKVASGEILQPIPRFTLSEQNSSGGTLYAFLVPWGESPEAAEAASNYVACAAFTEGVPIPLYETQSEPNDKFKMIFLDGCADTSYLEYKVVLRKGPKLTDEVYTEFAAPKNANLTVKNVKPEIVRLTYNGTELDSGATVHVSDGIKTSFTMTIDDASKHDLTNGTQKIVTVWRFQDDAGQTETKYVTNTVGKTVTCDYTFIGGGSVQKVEVYAYDKDMDPETERGEVFTINVAVDDSPYVYFASSKDWDADASNKIDEWQIYENAKLAQRYLWVMLSAPAATKYTEQDPLKVKLEVERLGNSGEVYLSVTNLTFKKGDKGGGTAFRVTISNVTSDKLPDGGEEDDSFFKITATPSWKAGEEIGYTGGELELEVIDVEPTIVKPTAQQSSRTNGNITAGSTVTIPFKATDIAADANLSVLVEGVSNSDEFDYVSGADKNIEYTFADTDSGLQEVVITVTDKDGYSTSRSMWYEIPAFKSLRLTPYGASATSQSRYNGVTPGLGHGAVLSNGNRPQTNNAGRVTYYFAEKTDLAEASAWGLSGTEEGGIPGYDSFFYCWVLFGASEGGAPGAAAPQVPNPVDTVGAVMPLDVGLDPYQAGKDTYMPTSVEAIFSRELYPADNMGDINADGIPDLYVKFYGLDGDGTQPTTTDLKPITRYYNGNTDEDYLPATLTSTYGSLIPGLKGTWVTLGTPFEARLEIRGYHEGLNDAPRQVGVGNAKPDRVYEVDDGAGNMVWDEEKCTISYVEYLAWKDSGLPADKWTPECPTDPTEADTDTDGMPDGYEYFFWYRAHVGWMEGTNHVYLTGRRYNPYDPVHPTVISPSEIERIMNPRVAGVFDDAVDTDNDGLPDKIEFEIGTNPFDYDTDGDGLPDGYEVAVSMTDPLTVLNGLGDALGNPDGDVMAFEYVTDTYYVYGFETESGEVVYRAIKAELFTGVGGHPGTAREDFAEPIKEGWTFTLGNGTVCWTKTDLTDKTWTDAEGRIYLSVELPATEVNVLEGGDADTLGLPRYVARGTLLAGEPAAVPEDGDGIKVRKLVFTTDAGEETDDLNLKQMPPNRAYAAFQYGELRFDVSEKPVWGHFAVCGDAEIPGSKWKLVFKHSVDGSPVYLIHCISYQDSGFDPRTAWKSVNPRSRSFATYDEYLAFTFHLLANVWGGKNGILAEDWEIDAANPWTSRWKALCTDPLKADTDADGMPDGWELYVGAGPMTTFPKDIAEGIPCRGQMHPRGAYGPLLDYGTVADKVAPDSDGLDFRQEFCGVETCAAYPDVETIVDIHPEWRNKAWATDPWNPDTDGDGLSDGEEGGQFIYGEITAEGPAGGGLNPLSWDTDGDGLPDPWEAEFAGHLVPGEETTKTETAVDEETGETNTVTTVLRAAGSWEGGMDGTVSDARLDYDFDGLQNWQEYMAGTVRAWRYDDTVTPWNYLPDPSFDVPDPSDEEAWGQFWYDVLMNEQSEIYNPHWVMGMCDNGAPYMSLCTNAWDSASGKWYYFKDGVYHDLANPPPRYRIKVGDDVIVYNRFTYKVRMTWRALMMPFDIGMDPSYIVFPSKYISCDPTVADTDGDGLDDFYEMFHGMNPLLGVAGVKGDKGVSKDIIYEAYGKPLSWSAKNNYWNNGVDPHAPLNPDANDPYMDFVACPWLNGLADADPDGDDLKNQLEGIMPNLQAASTYLHTDPTPLWMTDRTYAYSLVNLYFVSDDAVRSADEQMAIAMGPDGFWYDTDNDGVPEYHKFADFGYLNWDEKLMTITPDPYSYNYYEAAGGFFWSFEENEGYDSDHDFLGDLEEARGFTKSASDPLDADDPRRRQAMWFDGEKSLLAHPLAVDELVPNMEIAGEPRQNYLYFTVECWAKPEDPAREAPQTLVERTVLSGESNPADARYLRTNFHIGIRNGRWYTRFDAAGTGERNFVDITDGTLASNRWTHVAATYDGHALKLYVDGTCVRTKEVGLQPEHSATSLMVRSLTQGDEGEGLASVLSPNMGGYEPVAFTVGASPVNERGLVIDYQWRIDPFAPNSSFSDFTGYFKGYIDEVRVWDGARAGDDIQADVRNRVRYDREKALANREAVYAAWRRGATRLGPTDTTRNVAEELPPQLMHHWTFDHLPGAVKPNQVIKEPNGFATKPDVVDSRAVWCRPEGWKNPWWNSAVPLLHSQVYTDYAIVPWIGDTVAHLPRFDLTTIDSIYWSENFAGNVTATSRGFTHFAFPRSAEPVSKWFQLGYGKELPFSDPTRYNVVSGDENLTAALRFELRDRHTEGDDLLPLGNAFPKRVSDDEGGMWDEQGPADAWAQSGADTDFNHLPDWWQAYARANYCKGLSPTASLDWDTAVVYNGVTMPAWQAYLRDLARGMLPGGKIDPAYADRLDLDGDKLPDWWENLYGVQGNKSTDGMEDPDHDGLSNYQEWLCSEGEKFGYGIANGYPLLDPKLAHSQLGQEEVDYFLTMTNGPYAGWYLGEILADHDMMEDDLEDEIGTDRTLYDAWSDYDEDGWTAWSELRYSTFKMSRVSRLVSHMVGKEEILDSPAPVVHTTLRYNGDQVGAANARVIVEAYAGGNLAKKPEATWVITPGESITNSVYLGAWEKRIVHGTLTPGHVEAGFEMFSIQGAFIQSNDRFSWMSQGENFIGTYADLQRALADDPELTVNAEAFQWNDIIDPVRGDRKIIQVSVDAPTQKGYLLVDDVRAGTIDMVTGDFTLDLSMLQGIMEDSGVHLDQYVYRLGYYSRIPTMQTKALTVSLAQPTVGALKEGTAAFTAFLDIDGDGTYTPGEPIGFAKDVEIGWDQVPALTIEMTDKSAAAGERFAYGNLSNDTVRIVRTTINGKGTFGDTLVKRRIVFSRNTADVLRDTVYEGDLVTTGKFGLDWSNLRKDILTIPELQLKDVTEVGYVVTRGNGSVLNIAEGNVLGRFTVSFPAEQTKPTAVSPTVSVMPIVESQRPTFAWSGTADNTAFALRICDAAGKEVWSNTNALAVLPPRDASGNYVWTAPVFIGRDTAGDAWILENGSNYTWQVAMFSPKFSALADAKWSEPANFRTALAEDNDFTTSYGTARVAVKYFGPATNDLSSVVVRLYKTADFTGVPAAQTRLFETNGNVCALADGFYEVTFLGLDTADYYACAFIDRNSNMTRDRWETWGYANQVGRGVQAIYTPVALAVDAKNAKVPSVTVYMEDTDVNQDDVPDCLTADESILAAASGAGAAEDGSKDDDGDGLTADEEASDTYTDKQKWDTDGDGMPDGWEARLADLDPLFNDATECMPGDVMAFEAESGVRVRNAAGATYLLLAPSNVIYRVGDLVTNEHLYTCYDYQTIIGEGTNASAVTYCGFGTNLTGTAATFQIDRIEPVTVAYVHAQVYDRYGYSLKTAIPQDGAIHTKPFMAIDKYMVVRYLAALGLADEEAMNKGKAWKNFTLKPMDADNDRDGMLDGWELFVMFGTNGCGYVTNGVGEVVRATSIDQVEISPWKFDDRALDLDGDGLSNVDENCDGNDPSDPWNKYSVYESLVADGVIPADTERFDDKVRRFGIGESELDDDWDLDLISNGQEMWSYYIDYANKSTLLADIDPTNAWSNGSTPDYFRTFVEKPGVTNYLGAAWNGAEFIEPAGRDALDMKGLARAGTRDYDWSGWDYWSVVRNGFDGEYAGINDTDLTFVLKYIDAVMPGECSAKTLPELREFVHTQWAGVERTAWNYNWDYGYNYSYTYDPETGTYRYEEGDNDDDDTDTRMTLVGDKLVTLDEMISFFGGRQKMEKTIDSNKQALALDEITLPEPKVDLIVKYAGDKKHVLLVDAYQVNPAYPEYGEQRTAFWNTSAEFNAGVARLSLATANAGSLKQGPARFVAYIDADGDGKLSSGDTWGSATTEIGYLGCDLTIALGAENPALPALRLTDGTNTISTLALVRSAINGKPLYNSAKGVFIVQFPNNAAREALYPDEYDTGSYIGIDSTLSSLENVGEIESVTYEVLRLTADEVAGVSVTNLNNYIIVTTVETNGTVEVHSNVVSRALNETVTLNYSLDRDVAKSIACAGSTADDFTFTFTVPTDTANMKFWLNVQTNGAETATLLGGEKGFILKDARAGVVVLDKAWFEANRITIPTGRTKFGVVLGNDKFGRPTPAVCAMAEVVINEGVSFDGRLAVKVEHPTATLDANLTIAAYESADLVNPVAVTNGCTAGEVVELTGLRPDETYYVAAWYVKDAADGRGSKARRMPYDTWGYVTSLGEEESGFEAKALKAAVVSSVTNTVWLQDTDFNANGTLDREEDFRAIDGDYVRSVDPIYGFAIAGVEEAEIFSDAAENDVFAYAEVPFYCVMAKIGGAETWFAVTNLAAETVSDKVTPGIPVGTSLSNLTTLCSTYFYDFGNSNAKRLALGTNVTWISSEKVMQVVESKMLILAHAQVYDRFGFNPNTANGRIDKSAWVNTRAFTSADKAYVTNYVANVLGLADAWTYALPIDYPDADPVANGRGDGILDGWELYVKHSPWDYADRMRDADGDGLDQLHEYDGGAEPTDPWNAYSMYENLAKMGLLLPGTVKFTDAEARKFGLAPATLGEDWDLDLITNIDELKAYYRDPTALADLSVTNAWSDGSTPDYFRLCGSKYLGELFNGAEFIEPVVRRAMGITTVERFGTRDYRTSGWDAWSTARYSILNAEQTVNVEGVVSDELMLIIRYWNVIRPGEFTGTTVGEAMEFFHEVWNGVQRLIDYEGNVVIEAKKPGVIGGFGTIHDADAAQTTTQVVAFFGGQAKMEEVIVRNKKDLTAEQVVTPEPTVNLLLKYAGNESYDLVLESYQVNSVYPEYGEQLTAQWTTPVKFDSGVTKVNSLRTPALGSLKQGPARFVAYIDADGDGRLSAGDTFGTADMTVGYLGVDVEIRLGEANPALPVVELTDDGSNAVNTVAFVRTKVNGQYLKNPRGVMLRRYENNVNRTVLYPADYVSEVDDYIGVDKYLASGESELDPSDGELPAVEEVTYEIVKLRRSAVNDDEGGNKISNTNLNHYTYNEEIKDPETEEVISNIVHTVDQQVNEEFTVRYSVTRDVAMEVKGEAASLENDTIVSFTIPTDRAVTKFWLEIGDEDGTTHLCYGPGDSKRGYLLSNLVPGAQENTGRVILDTRWFVENDLANVLTKGTHTVRVGLGNDKFPGVPAVGEWSATAQFSVNAAAAFDGAIDVKVFHPTADLEPKISIAVYEKADLANPLAVTNGCAEGETVEIGGLRPGVAYYVAAWYVKNSGDGRDNANVRMPYDTWGYLTMLGESADGFGAKAVKAVDPANRMIDVPMVTNLVFLQDTDWNDNNVIDRDEDIRSILGRTDPKAPEWDDVDCDGIPDSDDPDPVLDNSGDWIEGDVMAYQVKRMLCVQIGTVGIETNWTWYAVMDPKAEPYRLSGDTIIIPRGTAATNLTTLSSIYVYGRKKTSPYGLGTNVTLTAGEVYHYDWMDVVLVHNQVYKENGFNPNTANALISQGDWVNSKKFTKLDKYIVTNYLAAVGALAPDTVWSEWTLRESTKKTKYNIDFDFDGVPDGFELYTMFGHKPVKQLTKTPVEDVLNAWVYGDREFDPDGDKLANVYEYDGGHLPTDPWNIDTDRDGITDNYAFQYHLKGNEAGMDLDGDGLSNYAEYLISEVFKIAKLDPENPKTDDACVDYFRKMGELYVGEIFTDHDQIDDVWEGGYAEAANRYAYDPDRDDDHDGWSNYAEFRAGTDPTKVTKIGVEGYTKSEYPVPVIEAKVIYNGSDVNLGSLVFMAWNDATDPEMTSVPDAIWTYGNGAAAADGETKPTAGSAETGSSAEVHEKYIGLRPSGVQRYVLSGGSVVPGMVTVSFLDPGYTRDSAGANATAAKDANWYVGVTDKNGVLYDFRGNDVGTVDYDTGLMELDCSKLTGLATGIPNSTDGDTSKLIVDKSAAGNTGGSSYDTISLDDSCLLIAWEANRVGLSPNGTYYLADADQVTADAKSRGHVCAGLNTFMCFVDEDSDGAYTPGEPFGVVRGVDVGWQGAKFTVELAETSAITPRISLSDPVMSDRDETIDTMLEVALGDRTLEWKARQESPSNATERLNTLLNILSNRIVKVSTMKDKVRVRVVRYGIDNMYAYMAGVYDSRIAGDGFNQLTVMDKEFDLNGRDFLCEADFLAPEHFDIDWGTMVGTDFTAGAIVDDKGEPLGGNRSGPKGAGLQVTNMTYLVVIGDGPTSFRGSTDTNTVVNALQYMVCRRFETVRHLPKVMEPKDGYVFSARPTFRWSIPDEEKWAARFGSTYTAFQLQIFRKEKNGGTTLVYDSGVHHAPVRTADGSFEWTADAYAGDVLTTGDYTWHVAMFNSKFQTLKTKASDEGAWSDTGSFSIVTGTQQETDDHNYCSVDVAVKYTGPAVVLTKVGFVRVQAFETADFSGTPVAQTRITDIASVKDATDIRKNCTLIGLPFGTCYIRAYIDSNGNGVKDDWESWGCVKEPVELRQNQLAPIVGLYIEDADTDQDWLPDAWEHAKYGNLEAKGAETDPLGRIVLKQETFEALETGTANISRFLSGASLTFFQNIGNVSLALGLADVTEKSIAEIRAMVEKNIDPNTVKITSLVVDPGNGTNGKVVLTVAAKATDSIAGYLLSPVYELPKSTDVTINIYRKANLVTDQWTFVKAVSKTITSTLEARVEVPIEGVDFNSGFYKVEIVQ